MATTTVLLFKYCFVLAIIWHCGIGHYDENLDDPLHGHLNMTAETVSQYYTQDSVITNVLVPDLHLCVVLWVGPCTNAGGS